MSVTVMRKVEFCAGHRLLHHEGKCANLHGHNYVVEFHITADGMDDLGRVVDFSVINRLFKGWIEQHWDHGMLLWEADHQAIEALRHVEPSRVYRLPWNPTAESIAATTWQWKKSWSGKRPIPRRPGTCRRHPQNAPRTMKRQKSGRLDVGMPSSLPGPFGLVGRKGSAAVFIHVVPTGQSVPEYDF
jgi:6-pyruvoyltetrahydropterin/6-carboxytetrahydropterin synthase